MNRNEGTTDRIIRIVIGLVLVAWSLIAFPSMWVLLLLLGAVLAGTGVAGWCPAYHLVGIQTCPVDEG